MTADPNLMPTTEQVGVGAGILTSILGFFELRGRRFRADIRAENERQWNAINMLGRDERELAKVSDIEALRRDISELRAAVMSLAMRHAQQPLHGDD